MSEEKFHGARNHDDHRTTGRRAWCLRCSEWCYTDANCGCCTIARAEEDPCPHCYGTGRRQ